MSQEIFATQNTNTYGAELTRRAMFAQYARTAANTPGIISGGLVSTADLQLSAPASGMSVNVSTGECLIGGTEGGVQGGYYARNTAQQNLVVSAASPSNPRIDTIVFTAGDSAYTEPSDVSAGTNAAVLAVVTGTPTPGATLANLSGAAAVPASSLLLGYVLVPANATNIITADISNIATVFAEQATLYESVVGLTGATAASRYVGATAAGSPASGTFLIGDFVIDQAGYAWVCTAGGSPGTWRSTLRAPTAAMTPQTRAIGTAYQPNASRPTFVIVTFNLLEPTNANGDVTVLMDAANPPTTAIAEAQINQGATGVNLQIKSAVSFIVPPAFYYKFNQVANGGTLTVVSTYEYAL